jgi:hypothetical protein
MKTDNAQTVQELEGYLDLGMARESLRLARTILKTRPLTAAEFSAAVQALLTQADTLPPWKAAVESAFAGLPRRGRPEASRRLFHFYVGVRDWCAAWPLRPRSVIEPTDAVLVMWTALELGHLGDARRLGARCQAWLTAALKTNTASDEERSTISHLTEAMASFHAKTGRWDQAEALWQMGKGLQPFAAQAWEGLVTVHSLRAMLATDEALRLIAAGSTWDQDLEIELPGNQAKIQADNHRRFTGFRNALAGVVPRDAYARFGLTEVFTRT